MCIFTSTGVTPAAPVVGGIVNPGFRHGLSGRMRAPYTRQASLEVSHELGGGFVTSRDEYIRHYVAIFGGRRLCTVAM
ncbi:MAG: hypothetical protein ACREAB_17185 [Blastocatellia bacterium]